MQTDFSQNMLLGWGFVFFVVVGNFFGGGGAIDFQDLVGCPSILSIM